MTGQELNAGQTGSGKSSVVRLRTRDDLTDPNTSVIVLGSPPDALSWDLYRDAVALGQVNRTVLENYDDFDSVIQRDFLPRSKQVGMSGWREDKRTVERSLDALSRRRGFSNLDEHPLILEYSEPAIWLLLEQEPRKSITEMQFAFMPKSKKFRQLIRNCRDESVAKAFLNLPTHPSTLDRMVGPAKRFVSIYSRSPAIAVRDLPGGINLIHEVLERGCHYFIQGGSEITQEEFRFINAQIGLEVIRYKEMGGKRRVVLIYEEAESNESIGPYEARAVKTLRKTGLYVRIICQEPWFHSPEVTRDILQNTDHLWLRNSSEEVAEMAARDSSGAIDPYSIKDLDYEIRRTQVGWEQVPVETETELHSGGSNRSFSTRERPIYEHEIHERKTYFPPNEQIALLKKWNMNLAVGQAFAKSGGKVSFVRFPKPNELISEVTALQHYEEHRKRWPFIQKTNLGFETMEPLIGESETTLRSLSIPIRRQISRPSEEGSSPLTRWQDEEPENSVEESEGDD